VYSTAVGEVSVCVSCGVKPSSLPLLLLLAGGAADCGAPPKITVAMSRFMALHMMVVRIAPEKPTKAPTEVNIGSLSKNPSAQSAQPEYELSTVITTGMSAPPTEEVSKKPSKAESKAMAVRAAGPLMPACSKVSAKAVMALPPPVTSPLLLMLSPTTATPSAPQAAKRLKLTASLAGSAKGLGGSSSDNLPNATSEPKRKCAQRIKRCKTDQPNRPA